MVEEMNSEVSILAGEKFRCIYLTYIIRLFVGKRVLFGDRGKFSPGS